MCSMSASSRSSSAPRRQVRLYCLRFCMEPRYPPRPELLKLDWPGESARCSSSGKKNHLLQPHGRTWTTSVHGSLLFSSRTSWTSRRGEMSCGDARIGVAVTRATSQSVPCVRQKEPPRAVRMG
ncbi:hypothetical protein GUJ93_ZPchr0005g14877 [Zizania palustris]|uniref:Uncharacterized protein n=1 Tax=Zizania palustris TaxID=103762 RepID=A0A8J5SHH1_ZIZPA|nr:hypothetical protein GUJ93_ZPchr0005g14877 [Zizania palustris]